MTERTRAAELQLSAAASRAAALIDVIDFCNLVRNQGVRPGERQRHAQARWVCLLDVIRFCNDQLPVLENEIMDLIIETAIEWWNYGGVRTKERMRDIVAHYAHTYAVDTPENIDRMTEAAWAKIPDWKKEKAR